MVPTRARRYARTKRLSVGPSVGELHAAKVFAVVVHDEDWSAAVDACALHLGHRDEQLADLEVAREDRVEVVLDRGLARDADADKDGAVTQSEFTTAALTRFEQADANGDGTISLEERREARQHMRHNMRHARPARDAG